MSMTLNFGKYKDQPLESIPSDYLAWLREQGIRNPRLAEAVDAELVRREATEGQGPAAATPAPAAAPVARKATNLPAVELAQRKLTAVLEMLAEVQAALDAIGGGAAKR